MIKTEYCRCGIGKSCF